MAIKDILVHVDNSRAMPGRVRAGAELAQRHGAHLTGLFIIQIPVLPLYADAQIPLEVFEAQRAAFASGAAAAQRTFGDITGKSDISPEWRCVEDRRIDALTLHGRYAEKSATPASCTYARIARLPPGRKSRPGYGAGGKNWACSAEQRRSTTSPSI